MRALGDFKHNFESPSIQKHDNARFKNGIETFH